jgi:hypothetical protein
VSEEMVLITGARPVEPARHTGAVASKS